MVKGTEHITELIVEAGRKARKETSTEPEPALTQPVKWPIQCTVGPGLEGAIACETAIGYVNGSKGWLLYGGYDIFDLCAHSTFEEVSYLLLHGQLPSASEFKAFNKKLIQYRHLPATKRLLMGFPVEKMNTMAALRLATTLMRHEYTNIDQEEDRPDIAYAISSDEDTVPMETIPRGGDHAVYEFKDAGGLGKHGQAGSSQHDAVGMEACYRLIGGVASLAAAINRLRQGHLPIEPDPELGHAANFIYMMTGQRPTPIEERVMDVSLILHADHGMNASTFATMVVASTLSDIYLSMGAGIAALNGPLHGGANELVLYTLREIGDCANVQSWYKKARAEKRKIMGFGHRVYKAYDPRARVLGPVAEYLAQSNKQMCPLFDTAKALEKQVVSTLGKEKGIFPNVDFYSGIVYACMGIPIKMFTPVFAVSRVSGWTARVMEYLKNNRIFRPRAMYVGPFDKRYTPVEKRGK